MRDDHHWKPQLVSPACSNKCILTNFFTVSNVSERSVERSERRRGGIRVVGSAQPKPSHPSPKPNKGPVYPDPQYMMQMPPYGVPYMQGPYDEGPYDQGHYDQGPYGYPAQAMMYPQYGGYGMPPSPYMNFFPPVPEETEHLSHKHSDKTDKTQKKRHKSKETTHKRKDDKGPSLDKGPSPENKDDDNVHGFDDFALY